MAEDHLKQRKMILQDDFRNPALHKSDDKTTVGLSFQQNGRVEHVMVGGPAFASGIIHPGDLITRIDGRDVEHDTMLAALKGATRLEAKWRLRSGATRQTKRSWLC